LLISHKHKFIFLKTPKTAGTTTEIILSTICGGEDIITPVTKKDEQLRRNFGGRKAQNFRPSLWRKIKGERFYFYNHIGAADVFAQVNSETWASYTKFCFVRNPWDQVVSGYYMKKRSGKFSNFNDYFQSGSWKKNADETKKICLLDGRAALDSYHRYENLEEELKAIFESVSAPSPIELPRAKAGYRSDSGSYRSYYDETTKKIVQDHYSWLQDLAPYEF